MKNPWKQYVAYIEKNLTPYEVYFTPKEFIAMRGFGLLVGVTVGIIFACMHYIMYNMIALSAVVGVSFSIIGFLMPNVWITYLSKQNKKKMQKQLDETLDAIKEKMETEHDLMHVLTIVAEQTTTPFAQDLKRIHAEYTTQNKEINFEELQSELKKNA